MLWHGVLGHNPGRYRVGIVDALEPEKAGLESCPTACCGELLQDRTRGPGQCQLREKTKKGDECSARNMERDFRWSVNKASGGVYSIRYPLAGK